MNKKYIFPALMCIAAVSFTSCIEENFEKVTPAQDGDEIIFGARAGFENAGPDTRTVYSGETYTVGDKTFERIDWVDPQYDEEGQLINMPDRIEIHSPEAGNGPTAHYQISHWKDADGEKDYAYLTRIGDSSLQWKGDGEHTFYAMYPSSKMFETEATLKQGIKMEGTILKGTIPAAQAPLSITNNGGHYVAYPDMKYAYMAAKGTATREDGSVSLTFVPVVTAVQIQLVLDEGDIHPVEIGEITVQGAGISGDFTADLASWTETYPSCQYPGTGGSNITVTVIDRESYAPITLQPGNSLTFTVFLRPGVDYKNITVAISPTGSAYVGKQMNNVTIPANLKTRISNFRLPAISVEDEEIVFDASNWMEAIDENTELKKLSIPGTTGSFSYKYSSDASGNYRSQHTHMDIEAQWKAGIRAFEIVSDRNGSNNSASSLANAQVTCNKTDMGITVASAMEEIRDMVKENPKECAVVIFTYQPEGNNPNRNATRYANSLQQWFNSITYKDMFMRYTPDITLGDAKGKILVFVRLNQRDENDNGSFDDALDYMPKDGEGNPLFVFINGCGTGKDKWGARGYKVNGNTAPDISNGSSSGNYVEYYMEDGYIDPTSDDSANVRRGEMNFGYGTNDENVTCWFQEWARVINADIHISSGRWQSWYSYPEMYWFESYEEKKSNAIETFNMAISNNYGSYIFINSLSGYIAETASSPTYSLVPSVGSAYGGDGGNIKALADKLNPDFYKHVYNAGMDQTTGPTGIVMMDYVSDTPDENVEFDGSYRLPGLIISNNRKFGTGNSSSGGNTGGGNGDNNTETPGGGDNIGGDEGM